MSPIVGRLQKRFQNPWASPFMLTESDLPPILLAVVVESLLYGIHAVLFCISVRVLCRRRSKLQVMMLVAVVIMFLLATADVGVSWNLLLRHTKWLYSASTDTFLMAVYPKFLLHLVNNFIADTLLIIRCYVVWGNRKGVLYACGGPLLVGTVFGCIGEGTTNHSLKKFIAVYILTVLVLNAGVTLLTAGRIFWIAKEVRTIMGPKMVSHYHFAIGVLIESGLIYSASTILVLCLSPTNYVLMAGTIAIRIVCIVPTLLIVQIALGQSTKDVSATVSMLQGGTRQVVLDTIVSNECNGYSTGTHHSRANLEEQDAVYMTEANV